MCLNIPVAIGNALNKTFSVPHSNRGTFILIFRSYDRPISFYVSVHMMVCVDPCYVP